MSGGSTVPLKVVIVPIELIASFSSFWLTGRSSFTYSFGIVDGRPNVIDNVLSKVSDPY